MRRPAPFGTFLVGVLLTMVTLGFYWAWFSVNLRKFYDRHTRFVVGGRAYALDFTGTGGELFVLALVNRILITLTFGIYWFWARVKTFQWEYSRTFARLG